MMKEKKAIAYHLPVGKQGTTVELSQDVAIRMSEMQGYTGGMFDCLDIDPEYDIWADDEGLCNGSLPNRAIFTTEYMNQMGYLSQFDYMTVPKPGELYSIVFGNILVTGKPDMNGEITSLTAEQISKIEERLGNPGTGALVLMAIKMGIDPSQITAEKTTGMLGEIRQTTLAERAAGAREAADAMAAGREGQEPQRENER